MHSIVDAPIARRIDKKILDDSLQKTRYNKSAEFQRPPSLIEISKPRSGKRIEYSRGTHFPREELAKKHEG